MKALIKTTFLILFTCAATLVQAQNLPNYQSTFVNDFADIIDAQTEARITQILKDAKDTRDLEMTVVTIERRSDYGNFADIADFGTKLFNHWGVGNPSRTDGVMIVVARTDRDMRIALGSGYPAIYDDRMKRVIDHTFIPFFRENRYAEGIEQGVLETLKRTDLVWGPDGRPTMGSRFKMTQVEVTENAKSGGFWAWFLGFLGLGGAGAGALGVRAALRHRPRSCDICGRKMQRLAEFEDDYYLTQGQRVEEALKSKDYDVWYCQNDDHTLIEGYRKWFSSYSACPQCSHRTLHSQRTVVQAATTSRAGKAEVENQCRHCDYWHTETVVIPRVTESSSSSGGGSSFSGGSSSGGGASGSW